MVTTYHADNALKTLYLDVMMEKLNMELNPLLTKIKQTCDDVWGKEIRTTADSDEYIPFVSVLKNLIAQVEIPEKVLRSVGSYSPSAFIDYLNDSCQECLSTARKEIGQMLYGDGTQPRSLTGIGAIFDMSKPLYEQERTVSPIMRPLIKRANKLSDAVIDIVLDHLYERGATIDYIAVSQDVKQAYVEQNKYIDIVELNGGFKALSYNGIPLVYDRFVPKGTMYLLDTSVFKLHQLCDWRWLEIENGKILRESYDGKAYTATLVKYCDLICHRPDRQGMIKFTENI